MMKQLHTLKVFSPFVMMEQWGHLRQSIIDTTRIALLQGLPEECKKLLAVESYHYWDPNYPENGKILSLIDFLIFDTLGELSTLGMESHFYTEYFIHNVKEITGVDSIELLAKHLADMQFIWEKRGLAQLTIKSQTESSCTIAFELLVGKD